MRSMAFLYWLVACWIGIEENLQANPLTLRVKDREIVVNGKKAQAYEISQFNGTQGLFLQKGERFEVIVENHISQPTGIHWHGLILPNDQDGVPFVTQPPIFPGEQYRYSFPLVQAGTFWMHAHYGLQEQRLLAAPLILSDLTDQSSSMQEVVMFLSDFSFRHPSDIFQELKRQGMKGMSHLHDIETMKKGADLNDVKYDAFLTNWRTLSDPEVVLVSPEKEVRLRIINGSSSSNFFIQLGALKGEVMATDGSASLPLIDTQFELAVAQRLDLRIKIPAGQGVYPILAQGEGVAMRTGLLLATAGTQIPKIKELADQPVGAISYRQELLLKAKEALPKKEVNRHLMVNLGGNMSTYVWTINGKTWPSNDEPLMVKQGERVEMTFVNHTAMSHPMHLHGHVFQVTEINGHSLAGALRDTVLVLPHSTVKVQFEANQPGHWPLHCHNLYHQHAGMMTTLNYMGYKGATFSQKESQE